MSVDLTASQERALHALRRCGKISTNDRFISGTLKAQGFTSRIPFQKLVAKGLARVEMHGFGLNRWEVFYPISGVRDFDV